MMYKIKNVLVWATITTLLNACSSNETRAVDSTYVPNVQAQPSNTTPNTPSTVVMPSNGQTTVSTGINPTSTTQAVPTQQQVQQQIQQQMQQQMQQQAQQPMPQAPPYDPKNTKPNPAHGQPGHRCDISVGAPLNSKPNAPAAAVAPPTTVVNSQAKPVTNSPAVPVAAGMNPAHGQPGHRCDISVGAPLNSKPNTQAAVPQAVTQPAAAPIPAAKKDSL
jgi:hypothetical protein